MTVADPISTSPSLIATGRLPRVSPQQWMLLAIIATELIVFSLIGTNFLSLANAFAVLRLNVEIGVISLALTPVIVSGGIDLSVGSVMGLAAV